MTDTEEPDASGWHPGEVSPLNPGAVRGPNGIWNEESLPVLSWEAPQHRVVLTSALVRYMGLENPVVRWSELKWNQVVENHRRDRTVILNIDHCLGKWKYVGKEAENPNHFRVLFELEDRWYSAVIGKDRLGETNVVTVFGSSKSSFRRNRLRGMVEIHQREK